MKTENGELMRQARQALSGKWGMVIGAVFVSQIIGIVAQSIPKGGPLIYMLIAGPLSLGVVIFTLALSRGQNAQFEQIFDGFKHFKSALLAHVLMLLFIFLWALLLVIPGIIAGLSYAMTYYILADDPNMSASDAIKKSKHMMYGYKWKLFTLHLRFLGWVILCVLSLGIGFLWLVPYMQVASAKFYEDLKNSPPPVPAATA